MFSPTANSLASIVTKIGFHQSSQFSERSAAMPKLSNPVRPLAALAAALLLAACSAETAPAPKAERPVQVQSVAFQAEDAARDFVGVVRARYETDLGFRVGGKMVARLVNMGDRVHAGDVVARLDPEDLRLQVESAEAELAAATTNLNQTSADFERYETLKARGYASIADFDRKTAAKGEADSRLARAKRSLDLARNQLDYAELRAGADGVITATLAEPGQVVSLGQPVVKLAHRGEKEAVVALPENWLAKAREANATVTLWSGNGHRYAARLRELSPQADQATRTYAARFTILRSDDNSDDNVALGMTATVTLKPAGEAMVAKVPLSAVLSRGSGASVYVVSQGGELTLRPVTVASFNEDDALITGGVSAGEKVVTLGVQKLEPGLKVRSIEAK
jgi:RND family efflux transporter MFP subunit